MRDQAATLGALLRALVDAEIPPDGPVPARAFDFRGRLTKLAMSRDVCALRDAPGAALLQRGLDAAA